MPPLFHSAQYSNIINVLCLVIKIMRQVVNCRQKRKKEAQEILFDKVRI